VIKISYAKMLRENLKGMFTFKTKHSLFWVVAINKTSVWGPEISWGMDLP